MDRIPHVDWSRAANRPEPPEWARLTAQLLGYPVDTPLERRTTEWSRWNKRDQTTGVETDAGLYQFDTIGIPILSVPDDPEERPDVYCYGYRRRDSEHRFWIRSIVTRVMVPNQEVYAERTYRADGKIRVDICGLTTCRRDGVTFERMIAAIRPALDALEVNFPSNGTGRPLGSGYVTSPASFRVRVFPIIRSLDDSGRRPSKEAVCDRITATWTEYRDGRTSCDPAQLRRWFRDDWENWKAVVREALNDR